MIEVDVLRCVLNVVVSERKNCSEYEYDLIKKLNINPLSERTFNLVQDRIFTSDWTIILSRLIGCTVERPILLLFLEARIYFLQSEDKAKTSSAAAAAAAA